MGRTEHAKPRGNEAWLPSPREGSLNRGQRNKHIIYAFPEKGKRKNGENDCDPAEVPPGHPEAAVKALADGGRERKRGGKHSFPPLGVRRVIFGAQAQMARMKWG